MGLSIDPDTGEGTGMDSKLQTAMLGAMAHLDAANTLKKLFGAGKQKQRIDSPKRRAPAGASSQSSDGGFFMTQSTDEADSVGVKQASGQRRWRDTDKAQMSSKLFVNKETSKRIDAGSY